MYQLQTFTYAAAPHHDDDAHLKAYNAVFAELGLRFRWDHETLYSLSAIACEKTRIAKYLKEHHAHLLKAYDVNSLSELIYDKKSQHYRAFSELTTC